MKRTQIGELFGEMGYYISQPGDDLNNPTKALLLDSRYDALDIHAWGRGSYNRDTFDNESWFYSLGEETFSGLGYLPIFNVWPIKRDADKIFYPGDFDVGVSVAEFKASIQGSAFNQIHTELRIFNDTPYQIDFFWIVFRNPF